MLHPKDDPMSDEQAGSQPDREEIALGVIREWLDDRQIVKYVIEPTATQAVLQQWSQAASTVLEEWDVNRPYLALYDVHDRDIVMTAFFQQAATKIAIVMPAVPGRIAVVIPPGPIGFVTRLIINHLHVAKPTVREIQTFQDMEDALTWLREMLA